MCYYLGTTNSPMSPQIPLITVSMHQVSHITWCGKIEYTNIISITKKLPPKIPQTPDNKPNFQQNKGNIHGPIPLEYNAS